MSFTGNQLSTQDLYSELVSQSWKDESFKRNLIDKPVQTIESFIEKPIHLTTGKQKIVVEDQTDNNIIYLNIPARPNLDELELTEVQLEMVAGGSSPACLYGGCLLVGIIIGVVGELRH